MKLKYVVKENDLYKNINQKRNELLEKLKKEGLSDDEQKQLDEINEKMNEIRWIL